MELPLLDPAKTKNYLGLKDGQHVAPTVFAMTKRGPALVMDEGVGWFADKDGSITVLVRDNFNDWVNTIDSADVYDLLSDKTITLEELIGTYNDRYRANLSLWENQVDGVDQSMSVV